MAFSFPSSLDLDFPFNTDMSIDMKENSTLFLSPPPSSGYLQDALMEKRCESKRRRLLLDDNDNGTYVSGDVNNLQNYWNLNWNCMSGDDPSQNFNYFNQITNVNGYSDEQLMNSSVSSSVSDSEITLVEMIRTPPPPRPPPHPKEEEEDGRISAAKFKTMKNSSSSGCYKDLLKNSITSNTFMSSSSEWSPHPRRMKKTTRVVYPFEVVKSGGIGEGDITLEDINERILMPPTRPVRHPVGDFASRPCVSPDGTTGLSGKAVISFIRIHTQGRGTITIVKTRG